MDYSEGPRRVHFHDSVQINIHPLRNPGTPPRWDDPPSATYRSNATGDNCLPVPTAVPNRNETTAFHRLFLKAKPKSRGTLQIFVAHFQLALGIALIYIGGRNYTWYSYITFWAPPILVASGFLAVRAQAKPSYKLVKSCAILHSISGAISSAGVGLCCVDIFIISPCGFNCPFGNMGTFIIIAFLLSTNMLQLITSSIIAASGYRSLKRLPRTPPQNHPVHSPVVISEDPPTYSEISTTLPHLPALSQPATFILSPTYLLPTEYLGPPVLLSPQVSTNLPPPPSFSEAADPPPPYSE